MYKTNYAIVKKAIAHYMSTLTREYCRAEMTRVGRGSTLFLSQNFKTMKDGSKEGGVAKFYNIGLELLPSNLSGKNLCGREGNCRYSCLAFTGQNIRCHSQKLLAMELEGAIKYRAIRSWLYNNDRKWFLERLKIEILHHASIAAYSGLKFAVRLNVFSDVDWREFTATLPEIQFYDYTKYHERTSTANYHFTYSFTEKMSRADVINLVKSGKNVAMVIDHGKQPMPEKVAGVRIYNGDLHDARYNDPKGVIVGLRWKITAVKETDFENKFLKHTGEQFPELTGLKKTA